MSVQQAPSARLVGPDEGTRRATSGPIGWVHAERYFLDARTTHCKPNGDPITGRERMMWTLLEGYCGPKPFCWPGTAELAEAYGCKERTAHEILQEMEADGIIHRVFEGVRGKRVGIILLKRMNPSCRAPLPEEVPFVVTRLKEARERSLGHRRTIPFGAATVRKTAQRLCGKPRSDCAENRAFETEVLDPGQMETASSSNSRAPDPPPAEMAPGGDDDAVFKPQEESKDRLEGGVASESADPELVDAELAEALEAVRQAHGNDQAEAIGRKVPGLEARLRAENPVLELAYVRACILAGIYTIAAKKAGTFTSSPAAYFASSTPRIVRDWTPAEVHACVKWSCARPDPELARLQGDVEALKSVRKATGYGRSQLREHFLGTVGWAFERYDKAAGYLNAQQGNGEVRSH